jgi:acetyltransferase
VQVKLRPGSPAPHPLQPLLAPASVALVGASERPGSVGAAVLANLRAGGFHGPVFLVNPKHTALGAEPCHPTLEALPQAVDLAIVTAPAAAVPGIVRDAARARTRALVVLSAGFAETGAPGRALQDEVARLAAEAGIPLLGPNCLGLLRPALGLNASFARTSATPGGVALASQSGAVCAALVDWASSARVGLSSVVSLGAAANVDFGDVLDFLRHDGDTRSVLLYIEGVKHGRRFVSALRALARAKPVVALKVGRNAGGSRAARSHTGALAGDDAVFDAVLRRCGVVRVNAYDELFAAAAALSASPSPIGNRVAVVTNGGGPGALAADAAPGAGLELATLSAATIAALDRILPAHWPHGNPVDLIGDARGDRYAAALAAVLADAGVDGVVTAYSPAAVSDALEVATRLAPVARAATKPVFTSWLGGSGVREARAAMESAGVATFGVTETAIEALGACARWSAAQRLLLEAPPAAAAFHTPGRAPSAAIFKRAVADGRRLLTEAESKELLSLWDIDVPAHGVAATRAEALEHARRIGYPVAVKILSPDITHKSEVDGVRLGLADDAAAGAAFDEVLANARRARPEARIDGVLVQAMVAPRNAREVLVGVSTDPVFGPVITFGSGGVAVELLRDIAVALPPLNDRLARDLVSRTRVAKLLGAYRNVPAANGEAIVGVLLRISDMVCELPWIAEMDVNPLLVDAGGAIALDARIVIDPACPARDARWSHLAIHPYPAQFEHAERLDDGSTVLVRPIRPEDAALEAAFIGGLSGESRYRRFLSASLQTSPETIARFTQVDYDRDLALVAVAEGSIVGVARYVREADPRRAEFALVVADRWQGRGLGALLMNRLEHAAHEAGIERLDGIVLASNPPMLALVRQLGYEISPIEGDPQTVEAGKALAWTPERIPHAERTPS